MACSDMKMACPPKRGVVLGARTGSLRTARRARHAFPRENTVKTYEKPVLVQLGKMDLIKSNHTGPSSDGKKYAGFFK